MLLDDDFMDLVIKEVKNLWPVCQMVRGSPRHSESNGGVERVNQTVQKKLGGWMKTNNSKHWSVGCKIVQWRINTQIHQTLKDTPYHLTFSQHPRVGISNLPVAESVLAKLRTEAELNDVFSQIMKSSFNDAETTAVENAPVVEIATDELLFGSNIVDTADETALTFDDEDNDFVSNALTFIGETADTNVAVLRSPLAKRKNRSPQVSSISTRVLRDAKRAALKAGQDSLSNSEPVVAIDFPSPTVGKTNDDTLPYMRWLEMINERDVPVDLKEINHARVNSVFPIIYCINNKDIFDDANWKPCILRKVHKGAIRIIGRGGE
jgi:hypothetical protein